ncbi:MAG TPA: energy transducer TonB [Kofleriaceae bacterium]|nr:energy transducer TonB [Kofleriaceae bacterium]
MLLASVLGHAAVVAIVDVYSPTLAGALPPLAEDCVGPDCPRDLTPSCEADAALAAAARLGMCASPFADGAPGACAADSLHRLELDLIRCHEDPDAQNIELVDLSEIDIAPKPLVPDVAPTDDIVAAELIEKEVAEKLEEAQKEISRPDPTGQIVEITRPNVEMAPDRARYLSEYDSKVDKQTVARGSTEEMVARPAPRALPPTADKNPLDPTAPTPEDLTRPSTSKGEGSGQGDQRSLLSMRGPGESQEAPAPTEPPSAGVATGERIATADGISPRFGEGGLRRPPGELAPGGGEPGGGEEQPVAPDLRPSEELLERAVGGGSVDHIEDAETGEFTALNSRKWKYATFFNRMKRQVAQNWHPDQVYLRRDPTGNVYGTRDRLTVLQVSLKPDGAVAKIFVTKKSGVDFLDDEAVRAFQEAQPFPNPPSGLVDARSNLITFSFGFHFQIGGDRGRWKVFRYQ